MATTVSDYQNMHGKTIVDAVSASLGATLTALFEERAWALYNLSSTDPANTEDHKEMIALTSLVNMVASYTDQLSATSGAVQRIKVGGDGTPDITFFDRAQTMLSYRKGLYTRLTQLQRKLGYAPFLMPDDGDTPFTIARVDMNDDTISNGEDDNSCLY